MQIALCESEYEYRTRLMDEKCDSDAAWGEWTTKVEPAVAVVTRSGKEVGPEEEEESSEDPS